MTATSTIFGSWATVIIGFTLACLCASVVSADGVHSDSWERVLPRNSVLGNSSAMGSGTSYEAAMARLRSGSLSFILSFRVFSSAEIADADAVIIPTIVSGICVAYNVPSWPKEAPLTLTLEQVIQGLAGERTVVTLGNNSIDLATLSIQADEKGAFVGHIRASARSHGVSFSYLEDLEARVLSDPRTTTHSDVGAAVATRTVPNSWSFLWPVDAVSNDLPCARLLTKHPHTDALVPVLPSAISAGTSIEVNRSAVPPQVTQVGTTEAAYPLLMTGSLLVSKTYRAADEWLYLLRALLQTAEGFKALGMSTVPASDLHHLIADASQHLNSSLTVIRSQGTDSVMEKWASLSLYRFRTEWPPVLFVYEGGGSGAGIRAVKEDTRLLAAVESRFSSDEYRQFPTIQFIPAVAFAVSVVYNIPGVAAVVLPRCAIVSIFVGDIRYWDHASIQQANPTTRLPHELIRVVARSTRSGTTEVFTGGLRRMDIQCNSLSTPRLNQTSTWTENSFSADFASSITLVEELSEALNIILTTPYAIGFGAEGSVMNMGLPKALIKDEVSGRTTTSSAEAVSAAFERAYVHPTRLTVDFEPDAAAYPFIGVTYWAFRRERQGNATAMMSFLEFAMAGYESSYASDAAKNLLFVSIPSNIASLAMAALRDATADGSFVISRSSPSDENSEALNPISIIGIALGCALLMAVLLILVRMRGSTVDNTYAPKDQNAPVGIIFTDIESSTSLWGAAPEHMGPALDLHNATIRKLIKKHRCYEVKTVGDAFMIACESPTQAVLLSIDIQEELFQLTWPEPISGIYLDLHDAKGWAVPPPAVAARYWSGLRVRIGIATGLTDMKEDETSLRYDYFGSTVNRAARIEAAGHGGQILIDEDTFAGAEALVKKCGCAMSVHPDILLRGFSESVTLTGVLSAELSGRTFPELKAPNASQSVSMNLSSSALHFSDNTIDVRVTEDAEACSSALPPLVPICRDHGDDTASAASTKSGDQCRSDDQTIFGVKQNPIEFINVLLAPLPESDRQSLMSKLAKAWRVNRHFSHNSEPSPKLVTQHVCSAASKALSANQRNNLERKSSSFMSSNTGKSVGGGSSNHTAARGRQSVYSSGPE